MSERIAPEDAVVIAEVLRRIRQAVGRIGMRADGNLNQRDVYEALSVEFERALNEAEGRPSWASETSEGTA